MSDLYLHPPRDLLGDLQPRSPEGAHTAGTHAGAGTVHTCVTPDLRSIFRDAGGKTRYTAGAPVYAGDPLVGVFSDSGRKQYALRHTWTPVFTCGDICRNPWLNTWAQEHTRLRRRGTYANARGFCSKRRRRPRQILTRSTHPAIHTSSPTSSACCILYTSCI